MITHFYEEFIVTCTRNTKEICFTFKQPAPSWSPNDFEWYRMYSIEWVESLRVKHSGLLLCAVDYTVHDLSKVCNAVIFKG
jgi:hypothetical protein